MNDQAKILLVEDDQNFGDVLRSYLEMHDYDITLATDGEAGAVAAARQGGAEVVGAATAHTSAVLCAQKHAH